MKRKSIGTPRNERGLNIDDRVIKKWNKAADKALAKAKARLIEIGSELNRFASFSKEGDRDLAHKLVDEREAIYQNYPGIKKTVSPVSGKPLTEILDLEEEEYPLWPRKY